MQVPQTQRDPTSITCNPKPEVALVLFTAPSNQPSELNPPENLQEVPPDLQDIQPFLSQVWNFS